MINHKKQIVLPSNRGCPMKEGKDYLALLKQSINLLKLYKMKPMKHTELTNLMKHTQLTIPQLADLANRMLAIGYTTSTAEVITIIGCYGSDYAETIFNRLNRSPMYKDLIDA